MAGNIKGITIQFEGDTTKLDKALRQVDKSTRNIDKELKQVNKALKFNPTSVTLWQQKQTLLTQKVAETKKKLDALKQAQAKMDAAGVDKNSQEYRELQREIIETESKLNNFEKQLRQIGNVKLRALSEQFKQVGDKMKNIGKNMSMYVTGPIVAMGAASVKAFNEVQDGLNIVANKTGATGKELAAMQETAKNLATSLPASFEQTGTAVGELNTRFGVTGQELESLSAEYIKFAKVNGVDLNNSIDQSQKALAAFGLSAAEAPALLDTLTLAGQKTGASVDTLTAGLIQNGTAFQELGLNIDQAVMLMAQMETSGANSETVMQGLRKALKNAAADGVPLNEALTELQDAILNGTDGMDGLTAAYDLFGKSGDQIYGAVKNGSLDFTQLAAAAGDAGGTLESVFNETLTPADQFQMSLNSAKTAGYEVGGTILTMLTPALEKLGDIMQKVADWWANLSPGMQKAITIVLGIVAAIGPLLVILGTMASLIGSILGLVAVIGPAIAAVAAPIGIAIAAIAAAIAIGIALYKNWDKIKAFALKTWNAIKAAVMTVVNQIKNSFNTLKTALSNVWNTIKTAASTAWNAIKNAITKPIQAAKDKVSGIISKLKGFFPLSIGKIFSNLKLPHFSVSGKAPFGIGGKGVKPSISVKWYARAMEDPYMFSSPTFFGAGEAGDEILYGRSALMRDIANAVGDAGGGDEIVINVYGSDGMSVEELAAEVERRLIMAQKRRTQAWA